jgi:hypothetical protein
MLPALEARFRIIPHSYARLMMGGSTGGWISAALQVRHPDQFGGAWIFAPDPVDFREFCNMDLYSDRNAFQPDGYEWMTPERYMARSVKGEPRVRWRDMSRVSTVLGSHGRSGEFLDSWSAIFGPVGADGYPQPIWNHETGEINHQVAEYWRIQGFDLRDYLERNWSTIGRSLIGKLHFAVGEMDNFYLNNAVYRIQEFLENGTTKPPYGGSFKYGRPQIGHEWFGYDPWPMALLSEMAEQVSKSAPPDSHVEQWQYP